MTNTLSTNQNKEKIGKIQELLEFVQNNRYSDFYQKKYGTKKLQIDSYADFQKIPFLTKTEFLDLPLEEITFVSPEEILFYSFSGGTSSGKPTVLPVSNYGFEEIKKNYFNEELFARLGVKTVMTLLQPSSAPLLRCLRLPDRQTVIIPADIHNLTLAAKIAKQMGIQGIIATTSRLNEFVTQLENISFDLNTIKWISTGSEFCPASIISRFKAKMPNTYIEIRCGNSDIGGSRGFRCQHLAKKTDSPELFHPTDPLIEIINKEGRVVNFGELGEIVHTDIKRKAFPVIRYKTGDMGMLTQSRCECGNELLLTFEGKQGFDFIEISGRILRSRAIADALCSVAEYTDNLFQLHIFGGGDKELEETRLILHLKIAKEYYGKSEDDAFKKMLSQTISENMMISQNVTFADLIKKSQAKPLEIELVIDWEYSPKKAKHIIFHDTKNK